MAAPTIARTVLPPTEPLQALAALSDPQSPVAVSEEILKPVPDPPVPQPRGEGAEVGDAVGFVDDLYA